MSYEAYIRILAKIKAADPANRFKRPDELLHLLKLKARNLKIANSAGAYEALTIISNLIFERQQYLEPKYMSLLQ